MSFKVFALAAVAAAVISSPAAAVIANGTFAAAFFSPNSSLFGLQAGTTVTNTGAIITATGGDFIGIGNPFFTVATFKATNGTPFSFSSSFGNFTGSIQSLTTSVSPNATIDFDVFGTFTPSFGVFNTAALASITFGLTQTGALVPGTPQPSISGSFTLSSPPTVNFIPEPAAWAMLIAGFGLTGAAMRRRRVTVAAVAA